MNWNPAYALLLLTATLVTYSGGLILNTLKEKGLNTYRRPCLIICLIINLGILCFFKYLVMFVAYLNKALSILNISELSISRDIILPVGISFFTLQSIGYLIDVYREDIPAEKSFTTYALFVSFFPQLVAGPIERSRNLLSQLKEPKRFSYRFFQKGLLWIIYGLMVKMVIADNLSVFVDAVYSDPSTYEGWYIVAATFAFSLQIYCDFYGYSIIAKGSAYLLGIELMSNFESPYYSGSVKEFWRRWHISLSTWFRDYLYIPLGGNKKGRIRKNINLIIVFLISGLWHGASMSFVFWGFLNGLYQVIANIRDRIGLKLKGGSDLFCNRIIKTTGTFILITFSWIPFRAGTGAETRRIISHMIFALDNYDIINLKDIIGMWDLLPAKMAAGALLGVLILGIVDYLKYHKKQVVDKILEQSLWFRYIVYILLILFILNCGCYGSANAGQFIYFQF
ncbi:MAG: MBOAT family protein [Lachnospiraceae bacterium]|nr:MBOAT family protein [Lachnospiraceae bacterium]